MKAITFNLDAGGIKYDVKIWVENRGGKAVIMRSANGQNEAPLDFAKDLPAGTSPTQEMINAKKAAEESAEKILKLEKEIENKKSSAAKDRPYIPTAAETKALLEEVKKLAENLQTEFDKLIKAKATCFFSLACFIEGTKLLARGPWGEGFRAIELLTTVDEVASRDEHDPKGEVQWKRVEEVFERWSLVKELVLPGGHVIGTTEEHPFHEHGKGWTKANELQIGDGLSCKDGASVRLEEIRETGEWKKVYNIRVADFHTYFVGDDDWGYAVWAHNTECTITVGTYAKPSVRRETVETWVNQFELRPARFPGTMPHDFQVHVAGALEYHVVEGHDAVWVDGVNRTDGLLQEVKFILNPSVSLYIPGSKAGDAARTGAEKNLDFELERYSDIVHDPNNPIRGLQIITSNIFAANWFAEKMRQHGVPGRISIVQFGPFSTTGQALTR